LGEGVQDVFPSRSPGLELQLPVNPERQLKGTQVAD